MHNLPKSALQVQHLTNMLKINSPGPTGKVEDLGSGEYKAYFTATVAGKYSVSACFNGSNIAGSPFAANVVPVEVDAACSFAAGDGVLCARSGHPVSSLSGTFVRTTSTPAPLECLLMRIVVIVVIKLPRQ